MTLSTAFGAEGLFLPLELGIDHKQSPGLSRAPADGLALRDRALAMVTSAAGHGGMTLDASEVHAVLGLSQEEEPAPPLLTPSSPFMKYLADLLTDPSKVTEFAFACTFVAPLRGLCGDFSEKFLECAMSFPCAFKSLCVTLLMWYTLVFQALCPSDPWPKLDALWTDPDDPDGARAHRMAFPFDWDTERLHVEDGFLQHLQAAGWHGLCDWDRNFIPCPSDDCYSQIDVGCSNVLGSDTNCTDHGRGTEWSVTWETDTDGNGSMVESSREADVLGALHTCRKWGAANNHENGYFYQQHSNGHMICGFYNNPVSITELNSAATLGHQMGAICSVRPTDEMESVKFGRLPLEPFLQVSLEYVAKNMSLLELSPIKAALLSAFQAEPATADCVFDTTGEFLPLRIFHQALQCESLTLRPQSLRTVQVDKCNSNNIPPAETSGPPETTPESEMVVVKAFNECMSECLQNPYTQNLLPNERDPHCSNQCKSSSELTPNS